MKVGDQIRVRMEQLGVPVNELAKRVGVSGQAVRHWIANRSFPGKRHAPAIEQALSFTIDFTQGASKKAGRQTAAEMMDRDDIELLLAISKLNAPMKAAVRRLALACLDAQSRPGEASFSDRHKTAPVDAFFEKGGEVGIKKSKRRAGS